MNGAEHRLTAASEPLEFDGAVAVDCRLLDGPTQDLNLMVRQGRASARMQRIAGDAAVRCSRREGAGGLRGSRGGPVAR